MYRRKSDFINIDIIIELFFSPLFLQEKKNREKNSFEFITSDETYLLKKEP